MCPAGCLGFALNRVVFLLSSSVILNLFSSRGWESGDVEHRPLIPEGMPVLVDDDLCFEDGPAAPRPTAAVNRLLRELPASGAPAPSSWENYARAVKAWMEFLAEHGVGLFDSRGRLKAGLSRCAEHRAAGPLSCLLALKNGGGPFTAWATVFERTSDRSRVRFEPRFPHVWPHRYRHTFSMRTLEYLVTGQYRQAAKLVRDTDAGAALVFYLTKADPLLVLRDFLAHSTVLTTEKYLRRLNTTRIYREAYEGAGAAAGLTEDARAEREAADEFAQYENEDEGEP